MNEYKIPQNKLVLLNGLVTVTFHGTVQVDYPKANIKLPVSISIPFTSDYTYTLHLDPKNDRWVDQDTHYWTYKKVPITVKLSINKKIPKLVTVEVLHGKKIKWQHEFDIYDPYKARKVEMFAQPAFIDPIKSNADHTYAVGYADDGKRNFLWPCGGDHDENQRSLGEGQAFQPECDCVSQIHSDLFQGLAGIRYGVDGVCHQATNRIVATAGIEVTDAKGYKTKGWKNLTYLLYGRLGLMAPDDFGRKIWQSICNGCLTKQYKSCAEESIEMFALNDYDGLSAQHIDNIHHQIEHTRLALLSNYKQLEIGKINAKEYTYSGNLAINGFKNQLQDILGKSLHRNIFGEIADEDVVVLVPQIAQQLFAKGTPDLTQFIE